VGDIAGAARERTAEHCERLLLRLNGFVRIATLAQLVAALVLTWERYRHPMAVAALVTATAAESALVYWVSHRRGRLDGRWLAVADACSAMVPLIPVDLLLLPPVNAPTDNIFYPYTVAAMSLAGFAFRSFPGVLVIPTLAAASYVELTVWRFGFGVSLLQNALTYWVFPVVCWALARKFRQLSRDLDLARDTAVARETELARERERTRHARDLHDRILQTMEFLGRDGWVSDLRIREHITQEAAWLRAFIQGSLDGSSGGLDAALGELVRQQTGVGFRVELNTAGLGSYPFSREITEAVAGAVTEALNNVRKHAGTPYAVVRAASDPIAVTVTVLDQGRGFDPARVPAGLGLRQSITARIEQLGGTVRLTSAPGEGTHVELRVPLGCPPNTGHAQVTAEAENAVHTAAEQVRTDETPTM
jgi:signal transduction histidine kinase